LHKRFPHGEKIWIVDSEHMNRDAADRRPAVQRGSCPLEVFAPQIHAWVEEPDDLACIGICSRDVWTFVPIAVKTEVGGKMTILASVLGTLPDSPDNIPVHE